jgi:hypothetical protein
MYRLPQQLNSALYSHSVWCVLYDFDFNRRLLTLNEINHLIFLSYMNRVLCEVCTELLNIFTWTVSFKVCSVAGPCGACCVCGMWVTGLVQPVVQNVAEVTHICYVMVACATCFGSHWSSSGTDFIHIYLILRKISTSVVRKNLLKYYLTPKLMLCQYGSLICVNRYTFVVYRYSFVV